MKTNPANEIDDVMWTFLMDHGQKSDPQSLKEFVYDLIKLTTQKTGGQRSTHHHDVNFNESHMTFMSVVCTATALVLSGDLDALIHYKDLERQGRLLELPCKVGDTVYCIVNKKIICDIVDRIEINSLCSRISTINHSWLCDFDSVFITNEAAEKALAEIDSKE